MTPTERVLAERQSDQLEFQRLMDVYGPDTLLTWWRNCTAIMLGETRPSPSLPEARRI